MISQLRGILIEKHPPTIILEVNHSLGYEIQTSMQTFYQLPDIGEKLCLYTHLWIREDSHILYGFIQDQERSLFRALIKTNGIGPKVALAILSHTSIEQLINIVSTKSLQSLQSIPGIGKKTAERLLLELYDRFKKWTTVTPENSRLNTNPQPISLNLQQDAIEALISLGYKPQSAHQAIQRVVQPGVSIEQLIKLALQVI